MPLTGRVGEHYDIVRPLGSGAMGEVYLAVDRKMFDRAVAIKVLSERLTDSEEGRLRFRREVETSARLHHPNIVTIYDWGEHQGRDYFVMEFVEGKDLQVLLVDGVSWDLEQRLDVAFQMADALDFAHRAGVIHRDVKPGNVIVVLSDSGPRVKLVDFGIAHVERSNLTQEQSYPGTFTYMSPEQLRGDVLDPLDPRRDIFSLGIVLCELFGGHHPFAAKSDAMVGNRILCDEPDPPSRHGAQVPSELESLLLSMVAKDPERRPGTAREVADGLREASRKAVARSLGTDPRIRRPHDPSLAPLEARIAEREAASPEAREREEFIGPRMNEIDSALDAGKIDEALAMLSQILRKYPDQADAAVMLDRLVRVAAEGIAYRDYRAAVRDARSALKAGDPDTASASRERARMVWPDGPEVEALESEILAARDEARRRAEDAEAARRREREAGVRRQRELLERNVEDALKLQTEARAIQPASPDARTLRDEVLGEIAALAKGPAEPKPLPKRRRRFGPARVAATIAIAAILIALASFAVRGLFRDPHAEELDQILRLPEDSITEVAEKMKRIRAIDDLLQSDDKRKEDLARQEERLWNLNEMYQKVKLLEQLRDEATASISGPGGSAKLRSDAENVWDLVREYRLKLPDDANASLLEKKGRSLLSEIEDRTGARRNPDGAKTR